jgi:hypothetical protein
MFAFHETTRRRICRLAFIALCLAPTIATAAWIVVRLLPGYAAAQAARLGDLLQVRAQITGYAEPRPRSLRGDALTLSDAANGQKLLRLEAPRLHGGNGAYSVIADRAAIDVRGIGALVHSASGWLALPSVQSLEVYIDRLAIELPDSEAGKPDRQYALGAVQARLDRDAAGAIRLRVAIRQADAPPEAKPVVQLTVERTQPAAGPKFHVSLETATLIPAALLPSAPGLEGLNPEAMYAGAIQWTADATGLSGVAKGRLAHVAAASLLPPGSPHIARGEATIQLAELRWRDQRLERLEGKLSIETGEASASLIAAAVKHLYCMQVSEGVAASPSAPMVAFDRFACRYLLDSDGLRIAANVPPAENLPAACLAASGGVALLNQPQYPGIPQQDLVLPVGAWVQFVAGPASSWVPATAGAVKLADRLPLPK